MSDEGISMHGMDDRRPSSPVDDDLSLTDIDEVILDVGEFGYYQRSRFILLSLGWVCCALQTLCMVYANADVEMECKDGVFCSDDPCEDPENWLLEGGASNPSSIRAEWGLVCDEEWKPGLAGSAYFLGFLLGAGHFGGMADAIGRKPTFFRTIVASATAGVVAAAAPNFWVYVLARIGCGYGIGGMGLVSFVLPNEFVGSSYRATTGTLSNAFFALGILILAPVAYLVQPWRSIQFVVAVLPLGFFCVRDMIPESPRWLLVVNRIPEAEDELVALARGNGRVPPKISLRGTVPLTEETDSAAIDRVKSALSGTKESTDDSPGIRDLLSRPAWRRHTLGMFYIWFASSFVYYGLSLSAGNLGGSIYVNSFLSGLVEMPSYGVILLVIDKYGRRFSLLVSMVIAAVGCVLVAVVPDGALVLAMTGKFGITGAFAVAFVYAQELFPTVVRSTAMGVSSQAARIGGIAAPGVVMLSVIGQGVPMLAFGLVAAVACLLSARLPETLNRPLPQSLEDEFDDDPLVFNQLWRRSYEKVRGDDDDGPSEGGKARARANRRDADFEMDTWDRADDDDIDQASNP
eukprot:Rmarinus@m.19676